MRFKQERKRRDASFRALDRKLEYERLIRRHPMGRKSVELREDGIRLRRAGALVEFHTRQVEAAALFEQTDVSPAAAAAWFELANSMIMLPAGPEKTRLLEAERITERSLKCKARRRSPLRYAMTLDLMGQIQRRIAVHLPGKAADEREQEARACYEKAIKVALAAGFVGELEAAGYYSNLGNLLLQSGDLRGAVKQYTAGLETATEADRWLKRQGKFGKAVDSLKKVNWAHLELLLADGLMQWGQIEHRVRVRRLLKSAIDRCTVADPVRVKARLLYGQALRSWDDLEGARAALKAIDCTRLPFDARVALIEEWYALGDRAECMRIAGICREDAIDYRVRTITDFEADHHGRHAQVFAALWARSAMEEDPSAAFVGLDNFAAQRFSERISNYTLDLSDPITAVLADRRQRLSKRAVFLAEGPARLSPLGDHAVQQHLRAHLEHLREAIVPDLDVEDILAAPDPMERLRTLAREAEEQIRPVVAALERRHEALGNLVLEGRGIRSPDTVLSACPDVVLMRVRIEKPALAVVAWSGNCVCASLDFATDAVESLLLEPWSPTTVTLLDDALAPILSQLPNLPEHQLVVLPSALAALVPWPAIGYDGHRLLERYRSISQLPNTDPLLQVQRFAEPRVGTVLVAPGYAGATRCHQAAFAGREGVKLMEGDATRSATLAAAASADVFAFYGHGRFRPEQASIRLAGDEILDVEEIDDAAIWKGCERVELWACNSGVSQSLDWLSPPGVNEAFGIDMLLHQAGVRSTIGTLWPVSDFATGQIAGRFGALVDAGTAADVALASAQRWWLDELVPSLRRHQTEEALRHRLGELGIEIEADRLLDEALGEEPVTTWIDRLEEPRYWAGFRFVGVADARTEIRPPAQIDAAAIAAADAWIAEQAPAAAPIPTADEELARLVEADDPVDEARALRVARLLQSKQSGARSDQLLRALAWIDEARSKQHSRALDIEAAWIALQIGVGEWPLQSKRSHPADKMWLAHAQRLLAPHQAPVVDALRALLLAHRRRTAATSTSSEPLFQALSAVAEPIWRLRLLVAGADLVCLDEERTPESLGTILCEQATITDAVIAALWNELESRRYHVKHRTGTQTPVRFAARLITDEGIACSVHTANLQAAATPMAEKNAQEALNDELTDLENRYWGTPEQDFALLATTGTPGPAWLVTVGNYVSAKIETAPRAAIAHLIASIHLGSDIRVSPLNAHGWMAAASGGRPFSEPLYVQRVMSRWRDAVAGMLGEGVDPATCMTDQPPDPDSLATTNAWPLQETVDGPRTTLTFGAERLLSSQMNGISRARIPDEVREQVRGLAPPRRLIDGEAWLKALPANTVMIAGILDGVHRLTLVAVRQQPGGAVQRSWRSPPRAGLVLAHSLALMLGPDGPEPVERLVHWGAIRKILEAGLAELLDSKICRRAEQLIVLVPGALRRLPWAGLELQGTSLFRRFRAISHLPTLGFSGRSVPAPGPIVTVHGETTPHHAAVLEAVDRADGATSTRIELARSSAIDDTIGSRRDWRRIRLFGAPAHNATDEMCGVSLTHDFVFMPRNLDETKVAACAAVEFWTAPLPWTVSRQIHGQRDALPRLVQAGLETGAAGVLDIAWPVPERLKIIVYARHADACRRGLPPAQALVAACREVDDALSADDANRRATLLDWGCGGIATNPDDRKHLAAFRWWGGPAEV